MIESDTSGQRLSLAYHRGVPSRMTGGEKRKKNTEKDGPSRKHHASPSMARKKPGVAQQQRQPPVPAVDAAGAQAKREFKTKNKRSGVVFPVARLGARLRRVNPGRRISMKAPVYLAGVMQYLTTELLDIASDITRADGRVRITPRDLLHAVSSDVEFENLLRKVTIPFAGVLRSQPSLREQQQAPLPPPPPLPIAESEETTPCTE